MPCTLSRGVPYAVGTLCRGTTVGYEFATVLLLNSNPNLSFGLFLKKLVYQSVVYVFLYTPS